MNGATDNGTGGIIQSRLPSAWLGYDTFSTERHVSGGGGLCLCRLSFCSCCTKCIFRLLTLLHSRHGSLAIL